ncbi:hypothetical protein K450DRAFT_259943 [Umbelopsis ramanniana AG]|uniref:Uncharacterized protein n=1 Tax=Umbelopsis ramanniana AG TaxID=1314678 RepID=A0AAD5E2Y2_UMBRA|nr:uncharacterized protein K450DRAFT_259943 [Umbelopsis ramanniana AG]KAI8575799.1 hypothetical protein K450DRAFT_259943 [Umbelopsis ramanniana AG]
MSATKNGQPEEPIAATKTPLALPATADSDSVSSAEVNSSFKLSELGPVVINENGTMSRIENWHEMNDIERANVNRILLKRNKARLEKLKKEREGVVE